MVHDSRRQVPDNELPMHNHPRLQDSLNHVVAILMLGELRNMRKQHVHHLLHHLRRAPLEHVLQHAAAVGMLGHAERASRSLGEQQGHAARVALLCDQLGDMVAVGVIYQSFQLTHKLRDQHLAELGVAYLQRLLQEPASMSIDSQLGPMPRQLRNYSSPSPRILDELAQRLLPPLVPRQLGRQAQHRPNDLGVPDVGLHPLSSVGAAGSVEN
mmetsp:Transcript_8064/g.19120  ORF Transcript_8064/g.19120 Transcript_8064/m.19120 type:complete len:213 (+) Transcript_8064:593-1231(+)